MKNTIKKYCVYCHTLKQDGRKYIGITCQKPESRWNGGRGYLTSSHHSHFSNAIRVFGWEAFTHEILYDGLSQTEAQKIEIKLIEQYKTRDRKHGFNTQMGGSLGSAGLTQSEETRQKKRLKMLGQKRSEETKRKISEWHKNAPKEYRDSLSRSGKNKVISEKTRKLISESVKKAMKREDVRAKMTREKMARNPWNKGIPMSEDIKKKVSEKCRGLSKPKLQKAVICIDTGKIYRSIKDVGKEHGKNYSNSNVSLCCNGKRKTAYGLRWRFATEEEVKNAS